MSINIKIDSTNIDFIFNNKTYHLNIYYLDNDNYLIRLYRKNKEIFSTYIDSDGGEVTGNQEIYDDTDPEAIEKSYQLYEVFRCNDLLITGGNDNEEN